MPQTSLKTRWDVTVETLSPLHIGSGQELLLGYDIVKHRGHTYRVDEERLFEKKMGADQETVDHLLAGAKLQDLLEPADYEDRALFRYVMPGIPQGDERSSPTKEIIKDAHDRAYLPGSSLKGALRTVLFWGLMTRSDRPLEWASLRRQRSWASQPWEQAALGGDPNHDVLRALQVSDSAPLDSPGDHLAVRTARVHPTSNRPSPYGMGGGGIPINVEAVEPGAVFFTRIMLDEYLLSGDAARKLRWHESRRQQYHCLVALANERARERLEAERAFYGANARGRSDMAASHCETWLRLLDQLADNECLLQVGWGGGWESKTLGRGVLGIDDNSFEALLVRYRMTKERDRQPGNPFPRTRALLLNEANTPAWPLGWVRVRLDGHEPAAPPPRARARREITVDLADGEARPARGSDERPTGDVTVTVSPPPVEGVTQVDHTPSKEEVEATLQAIEQASSRTTYVGVIKSFNRSRRRGAITLQGRLRDGVVRELKATGQVLNFMGSDLARNVHPSDLSPGTRVQFFLGYARSGNPKPEDIELFEAPGSE